MMKQSLDFNSGPGNQWTRRNLLAAAPLAGMAMVVGPGIARADGGPNGSDDRGGVASSFPRQDQNDVLEVVRRSHFDLDGVRALVQERPALARASWDWGFGDWESALGAASHTGRREIAEVLMAHGARPNLFTAAMMGWLDVVRAMATAKPGVQSELGPHGITLLSHARAGGDEAAPVAQWLAELGGADPKPESLDRDPEIYLGVYRFGAGEDEVLNVILDSRQNLSIQRPGQVSRNLLPVAEHSFYPSGVPSVRIVFEIIGGAARGLSVRDGRREIRADRSAGD